jgi:hypothetical protein
MAWNGPLHTKVTIIAEQTTFSYIKRLHCPDADAMNRVDA